MSTIKLELGDPGDANALRHRAAAALERGLAFIDASESPLFSLLARVALEAADVSEAVALVTSKQTADGGFEPFGLAEAGGLGLHVARHADHAPLLGALEALSVLSDLQALHDRSLGPLCRSLEAVQQLDGSWGTPGCDSEERVFLTGMLGGLMGRTHFARESMLKAAAGFLKAGWSPPTMVDGPWTELAATTLFFTNVYSDESEGVLSWCGRELARSFHARRLPTIAIVRVLSYCSAAAVPGADLEPAEVLDALLSEQTASGGYCGLSESGDGPLLAPTLDAMRAMVTISRGLDD